MKRRAFTLLEVLAAIAILSMGLFGILSLMVLGLRDMAESQRISRAGTCAKAAVSDLQIRGWLDRERWATSDLLPSNLIIDPYGIAAGVPSIVAGIPRISLVDPETGFVCDQVEYTSTDDMIFDYSDEDRPVYYGQAGEYTWFATVSDRCVTAVACHKRTMEERTIHATVASSIGGALAIIVPAGEEFWRGDYVLLVWDAPGRRCFDWYRVRSQYDTMVDLAGPDLLPSVSAVQCVLIEGVAGISRDYLAQEP